MNVDLAKFLTLTTLMSAPLVAACDLTSGDDANSSSNGTGGDDGMNTTGGDTAANDDNVDTAGDTAGDTVGPADDTAGGSTAADGESSGDGPAPEVGDCCDAHIDPGCSVPTIEECVCAVDSVCCDVEGSWDEVCVALIDENGCGVCIDGGTGGTDGTGGTGSGSEACCDIHETAGCTDPAIEMCVCKMDAFCCGTEGGVWDETCVAEVDMFGCGTCG